MSFGIDFGANLLPFWLDFCVLGGSWGALGPSWGRLGPPCRLHKRLEFLNDYGINFLIILESFWEPSSARLGPRWRPKSSKNLTGGLPRGLPGGLPEPTTCPNSFLEASAMIFSAFLMVFIDLWTIVGWFLVEFWMSLVVCFQVFSLIFQIFQQET